MIIIKRELLNIGRSYQRMEEILRWDDKMFYAVKEKVSLWSPAQELWHIGMINSRIFELIEMLFRDQNPDILRKGSPTWGGRLMLLTGVIPRGVAKSPPQLTPHPEVDRREVIRSVHQSKKDFAKVAAIASQLHEVKGRFFYITLGSLNAEQWLRFVQIHTKFHLHITELIEKAAKSSP